VRNSERSGPNDNLTLSEAELIACRPIQGEGGRALRAFCPFHGSDHQHSLKVNLATGHFRCFACGVWGYLAEARERWQAERMAERHRPPLDRSQKEPVVMHNPVRDSSMRRWGQRDPAPARADLDRLVQVYQEALPGSLGERYLHRRGIPLELALQYGVGYAAPGQWAHRSRDWKWGRVVFPHTTPDGQIVNLYGRAVGAHRKIPKDKRHDHLPGPKGYFNAVALRIGEGPLFVCEGAFDALSLIAAGYPRTVAIFGVDGWRWAWVGKTSQLVFALDADAAGQQEWRTLAREGCLRGKEIAYLPPEAYGGSKDVNQAWVAGLLAVESWPAEPVMVDQANSFFSDVPSSEGTQADTHECIDIASDGNPDPLDWVRLVQELFGARVVKESAAPCKVWTPRGH
jgi:hypothetical protein